MKKEYFEYPPYHHDISEAAGNLPSRLYPQERDWTCSIACVRSICEMLTSEDEFLEEHKPEVGPHFSEEIDKNGWIPNTYEARFGHQEFEKIDASDLWKFLKDGYSVMVEWDISGGHWCVLTSITPGASSSEYEMTCFDPYERRMRVFDLEEFFCMCHDFVAVKRKI